MSKVISVRDLLVAEELSHIKNQIELIHPSNDALVASVLEYIGFDINEPWEYVANNHRDMREQVGVGFQIVGEYSRKEEHRHLLSAMERVIVAGMEDISLGKELAELMGKRFTYNNEEEYEIGKRKNTKPNDPRYYSEDELLEMGYSMGEEDDDQEVVVDDGDSIASQIEALKAVKIIVRGE